MEQAREEASDAVAPRDRSPLFCLKETFGFSEAEALELQRENQWTMEELQTWKEYLAGLKDREIKNPKAYCARVMRGERMPKMPKAPKEEYSGPKDLRIVKAQELARQGAWVMDRHGRRWEYCDHGFLCRDLKGIPFRTPMGYPVSTGSCVRLYHDWLDQLEGLNTKAQIPISAVAGSHLAWKEEKIPVREPEEAVKARAEDEVPF